MTLLRLPFPPGLNNLFMNIARGRAPTQRYKAWTAEAAHVLRAQHPAPIAGPFRATLTFRRPDRRIRDLDGLAKAPLDLLVKCGVVEDDHLAQEIHLLWSSLPPLAGVPIEIELEAVQ